MRLVEGDVRDAILLDGLFARVPFDAVVHLAARSGVRASLGEPVACLDVNVNGTLALLEAMRHRHVARLVFGSSSSVYGEREGGAFREEDAADRPISPYAASKRSAELLVHAYHRLWGISAVCLRFFTVYGPRQRPDLAFYKFARILREGGAIPVFGDGTTARDYTYVDDAVEAVVRALGHTERRGGNGPAFAILNVGRGEPTSLADLVPLLASALGVRARIDRQPEQPGDVPFTSASTERLETVLGFRPGIDIREGLRRFAAWVESPRTRVDLEC
jgi:UDP-glucuronate 4-epimerase